MCLRCGRGRGRGSGRGRGGGVRVVARWQFGSKTCARISVSRGAAAQHTIHQMRHVHTHVATRMRWVGALCDSCRRQGCVRACVRVWVSATTQPPSHPHQGQRTYCIGMPLLPLWPLWPLWPAGNAVFTTKKKVTLLAEAPPPEVGHPFPPFPTRVLLCHKLLEKAEMNQPA